MPYRIQPANCVRIHVPVLRNNLELEAVGSGYIVGPGIILTAAHVIRPEAEDSESVHVDVDRPIRLHFLGVGLDSKPRAKASDPYLCLDAQLCVAADDGVDIAVVRYDPIAGGGRNERRPILDLDPRSVQQSGVTWSTAGYPLRLSSVEDMNTESISGQMEAHIPPEPFQWLTANRPSVDWKGLSGAPVLLDGGRLVGVICRQRITLYSPEDCHEVEIVTKTKKGGLQTKGSFLGNPSVVDGGGQALLAAPLSTLRGHLRDLLESIEDKSWDELTAAFRAAFDAMEPDLRGALATELGGRATVENLRDTTFWSLNATSPVQLLDAAANTMSDSGGELSQWQALLEAALPFTGGAVPPPVSHDSLRTPKGPRAAYPSDVALHLAHKERSVARFRWSLNHRGMLVGTRQVEVLSNPGFDLDGSQANADLAQAIFRYLGRKEQWPQGEGEGNARESELRRILAQAIEAIRTQKRRRRTRGWQAPYLIVPYKGDRDYGAKREDAQRIYSDFQGELGVFMIDQKLQDVPETSSVELGLKEFFGTDVTGEEPA